ncbi:uncharacterized protein LOC135834598 isoform X3 [Planococcus citri]|uniref:uncharacterized protein LOC135834598 isoform X3 n=1 Tax=Planococcus citri TaxID=170843 RepID=UPI0031F7F77A
MSANTPKSENSHRILVIIVLSINLMNGLFGITMISFLECDTEIRGIYACIEWFILMATIIATIKKNPFMISCSIVIMLGEVFIYLCLSICLFYRYFFGILWQILADQSTENVKEEEVFKYMYILIVLFFIAIFFAFKYYSLEVLYKYEDHNRKISRSRSRQYERCDVKYLSGLHEKGFPDAPSSYDFKEIESAMSAYGNGIALFGEKL